MKWREGHVLRMNNNEGSFNDRNKNRYKFRKTDKDTFEGFRVKLSICESNEVPILPTTKL